MIDDALLEPTRRVELAAANIDHFEDSSHNAYPGPELRLPDALSQPLSMFFSRHLRERLGARRVQRMYSRLSLATRAPHELQPRQSICHVDRLDVQAAQCIAASVLYLFEDASLGRTSFFVLRRPLAQTAALLRDSAAMDAPAFAARYGIDPGYMTDSNDWFERVATEPARYNRLIVYNGAVFHSGDIRMPGSLSGDPRHGRLTLNGFFVCTRRLSG